VLLRTGQAPLAGLPHPDWQADSVGFEQLVLAYLQRPARAPGFPDSAREAQPPGPTTKVMSR
jgi:hypothetical protein